MMEWPRIFIAALAAALVAAALDRLVAAWWEKRAQREKDRYSEKGR